MNDDKIQQVIQGIGLMSELWTITYRSFKNQGLTDTEAIMHTKAFMTIALGSFLNNGNNSGEEKGE